VRIGSCIKWVDTEKVELGGRSLCVGGGRFTRKFLNEECRIVAGTGRR
jgi:hypothetical protein